MILRRLPAIVWTTDRKLRITSIGGAAMNEIASSADELLGKTVRQCFAARGDAGAAVKSHREALEGRSAALKQIWKRKAYQLYVEPLIAHTGSIDGCVGMAVDVTPRQHAGRDFEEELWNLSDAGPAHDVARQLRSEVDEQRGTELSIRCVQEKFLQLAASVESTFWIYDVARDRVLYLSPGFERMWGYRAEDALAQPGDPISRYAYEDDKARLAKAERAHLAGEATTEEFRIRRNDGVQRWIRARVFPVVSPGGAVRRVAGIAEDITQSRRDDEIRRRNERLATVGNFAAGIAHEVNNPLGAAMAAAQAALRLAPADERHELRQCVETILGSVRRCSQVVKSLLRFCRDEPANHQEFDLREALAQAASLTRTYADEHGVQITLRTGKRRLGVRGNPLELEIVLVNLLRNAIQADGKHVACAVSKSRTKATISVRDDGRGVDESEAARLCDPFFTTRRGQGGTGLGLSIVHEIVRDHGGTLEFHPNAETGLTVKVVLPQLATSKENDR